MFWVYVMAITLVLGALTANSAWASPFQHEDGQTLQAPTTELNIDEAATRAQQRYGGQLISIRPAEQDGRHGWQATVLLDNGRVKTLFVEARTGAVMDRRRRN
ncbi:MAG: hypothetical protein JJT88_08160 [Gammaproteobacteria bacterium]|jgi:uncharacterized membrane protein YkoI|nr:hypothetical protein [Gammaproteobacteria bacterium]